MGSAKTIFTFSTDGWVAAKADVLIIPVYKNPAGRDNSKTKAKNGKGLTLSGSLKELNRAMQGMIEAASREEKFDGSAGKSLAFRKSPKDSVNVRRVVLVGLGEREKATMERLESAVKKGLFIVRSLDGLSHIALALPDATEKLSAETMARIIPDAVDQVTYRSEESKDKPPGLDKVTILAGRAPTVAVKKALAEGETLAEARSFVKDLVNKPPNLKKTDTLVDAAKKIGRLKQVSATVKKDVRWIEKTMPCFFTVARGALASDPPKFISLHYKPAGGRKPKKSIALVGKGVIFDTGGYQVKTGNHMNTMKGDMTGSAVVLGAMKALAELKPDNIEVKAYIAAAPNMIDSNAMVPDSIVETTCGKKVEIRHTDAEGRLTLIDAVAMAAKEKPAEIITIATLTGSASLAVGRSIALMGRNEELERKVFEAAIATADPVQPLKVRDEDFDCIKSKLDAADIRNTSTQRERGAQSAAAFVMSGAPDGIPMAHMDIAGADMTADEKATGIGVKTLISYLLSEDRRLGGAAKKPAAKAVKVSKPPATRRGTATRKRRK